jgi:hypothetical protein
VLVVDINAILGSWDVAGVGDALPLTVEGLNAKVWVSLFRERHESLKEEGNIHITVFGFYNGKAEIYGVNEVSDLWWVVWGRVDMKDISICFDYRRCGPRGVTFVAEAVGMKSRARLCFVRDIHVCGCSSSEEN